VLQSEWNKFSERKALINRMGKFCHDRLRNYSRTVVSSKAPC
jgi:hypothetical protein